MKNYYQFASKPIACVITSLLLGSISALAAEQQMTIEAPSVPITGNPLGVSSDQLVVPVSVINGRELSLNRSNTLAETLNNLPSVSNSAFGPSVGRPMIRGMDSDRIKILQNGTNNLDASNLSFDHGVAIDPLIVEQIDVIRGPATLLYGGGAVGGVINAIDHRIPKDELHGITGRGEIRYGGASLEQSNAAVIDAGSGNFVMHFDAYNRDAKSLHIPNAAVSARKLAAQSWDTEAPGYGQYQTNHGTSRLINSQSESLGGAVGASMIFEHGYAGVSYAKHQTKYGSPLESAVSIDMDSDRLDFASEIRDLSGVFERAKFRGAYTDYVHKELEDGAINTTFKNQGIEGTFELGHRPVIGLQGIVGLQFDNGKFQALGDEAFVPHSKTNSQSIYLYEELPLDQHKLIFGLRHGQHDVNSMGGDRFTATNKNFKTNNGVLGVLYTLNSEWSFTGNLSHNERAPSYFELYADGVHAATGTYEQGQSDLKIEKSNGLDGQIRWKSAQSSLTFGAYYNKFTNYIGLISTNVLDDDQKYKISRFTGINADIKGIELEGKSALTDHLQLNIRGDYVEAKDRTNGNYLPRISPLKVGAGLKYEVDRLGARFDVLHAFKQNKVATNYNYETGKELVTDAYTNISMMVTYKLPTQDKYNLEIFGKANNLLDQEIREHSSFLKDIAPMGGRSLLIGVRGEF